MGDKGRTYPCEVRQTTDGRTGASVWQITDHPSINHNLYFLTPSLTPDNRAVIFTSYRNGDANFFRAAFPEGEITQLTDGAGIQGYSGVISGDGSRLYFTQAGAVRAVNLETLEEATLAEFPGAKLGEVSPSADERWLVSALRVDGENAIAVTATDGSGGSIIHRQSRIIIHPQFHPTDPDCIEYAADPAPRIHLIRRDGSENQCVYEHDNNEFVVHETWLGDTGDLAYTVWPYRLMRLHMSTRERSTIAELNAWHISPSPDGTKIVCDTNHPDIGVQLIDVASGERTTICYPGSSNGGSQWTKDRYALKEDFAAAAKAGASSVEQEMSWMEMSVDTIYGPQWSHPHPAYPRDGRYLAFTSDRTGHPQVYVVELPR